MMTKAKTQARKTAEPYKLQAIDRVVALFDVLSRSHTPLQLTEVATQLDLHKSTVMRFLKVLEGHDLVCRRTDGRYHLGLRLHDFGERSLQQFDAKDKALPPFRRLVAEINETGHLCVLRGNAVVYLDKISPVRSVCLTSRIGQTNPIHCTSVGKAMLAFSMPELRDSILGDLQFKKLTSKTHVSRVSLLRDLENVRESGYAVDDEEVELGVRCVGAPILNGQGYSIAAISISGPTSRISSGRVPALGKRLIECCGQISASLGYSGLASKKLPREV